MLWFWIGVGAGCLGTSTLISCLRNLALARVSATAALRVLRLIEIDPDNWQLSRHSAWHLTTGISIWYANDDCDLTVNGVYPPFSARRSITRALWRLRDRQLAGAIDRAIGQYAVGDTY